MKKYTFVCVGTPNSRTSGNRKQSITIINRDDNYRDAHYAAQRSAELAFTDRISGRFSVDVQCVQIESLAPNPLENNNPATFSYNTPTTIGALMPSTAGQGGTVRAFNRDEDFVVQDVAQLQRMLVPDDAPADDTRRVGSTTPPNPATAPLDPISDHFN